MSNEKLALSIRHKLFADRETIEEAMAYAFEVINRLPAGDRVAATTAMMVVLNTVSAKILENEKKVSA